MKTLMYGIGKNFFDFFNNHEFVKKGIIEEGMELVGFVDSNRNIGEREIVYNKKKFSIQDIDEFQNSKVDRIIITTKLYYEEIKSNLISKHYKENQIVLIDQLFESYLDKMYCIEKFKDKIGIEIGGPSELFSNIYNQCLECDNVNFSSNTIWWKKEINDFRYKNKILGKVWITEATDMYQIQCEKYDFVLSSNNLEHIANPLKALKEFTRILKKNGIILIVVPMKQKTFDHNREYTLFEHLLEDYINNIGEDDLSHLEDIIEKHDYTMDISCGGKEEFIKRSRKNIENRCLHHHVFDENCLRKSFEFAKLNVIHFAKVCDNWLILGSKEEK